MDKSRLASLDVLRALAALAVCFYHFDCGSFVGLREWSAIAQHGNLGVDVFFVVSGFVIPLTLSQAEYRFRDIGPFLASRFLRLYPSYFLVGLAAAGLWYVSAAVPGFRGSSPTYSMGQIVGNLFLACDFTGQSWVVPVFWTLAIEAQFYLLLGVSYSGLACRRNGIRLVSLVLWIAAPLVIGSGPTVFTWTALFAMGLIGFMRKVDSLSAIEACVLTCGAFVVHWVVKGPLSAVVGLVALLCIVFVPNLQSRVLVWIGGISYSLYLVHVPFGQRMINFAERYSLPMAMRVAVALSAVGASLVVAAIFFRFVEEPSHALSRKVRSVINARVSRESVRWDR